MCGKKRKKRPIDACLSLRLSGFIQDMHVNTHTHGIFGIESATPNEIMSCVDAKIAHATIR